MRPVFLESVRADIFGSLKVDSDKCGNVLEGFVAHVSEFIARNGSYRRVCKRSVVDFDNVREEYFFKVSCVLESFFADDFRSGSHGEGSVLLAEMINEKGFSVLGVNHAVHGRISRVVLCDVVFLNSRTACEYIREIYARDRRGDIYDFHRSAAAESLFVDSGNGGRNSYVEFRAVEESFGIDGLEAFPDRIDSDEVLAVFEGIVRNFAPGRSADYLFKVRAVAEVAEAADIIDVIVEINSFERGAVAEGLVHKSGNDRRNSDFFKARAAVEFLEETVIVRTPLFEAVVEFDAFEFRAALERIVKDFLDRFGYRE